MRLARWAALGVSVWLGFGQLTALADTPAPAAKRTISLEDYLKLGKGTMELTGDGSDTHHCQLTLTDKASGKKSTVNLNTICSSKMHDKSPPKIPTDGSAKDDVSYTLAGKPDPVIMAILDSAAKQEADGKYNQLNLPPTRRKNMIAQLAIWMHNGANDPENEVTSETLKQRIMKQAGITPKDLKGRNKKEFDSSIEDIFACVDLTRKDGVLIAEEKKKKEKDKEALIPPIAIVPDGDKGDKVRNPDAGNGGESVASDAPCVILVSAATVFHPSKDKYQDMVVTDSCEIPDPAN